MFQRSIVKISCTVDCEEIVDDFGTVHNNFGEIFVDTTHGKPEIGQPVMISVLNENGKGIIRCDGDFLTTGTVLEVYSTIEFPNG